MTFSKKETHIVEAVVTGNNFTITLTGTTTGPTRSYVDFYVEADLDIDIKDQERVSIKLNKQDLDALVNALDAIGYKKKNNY